MKIFGREPAVVIQAVVALLTLAVSFGLPLPGGALAAISLVLTAAATTWVALHVKPIAPTVFGGLIIAVATLAGYFGYDLSAERTGALTATVALLVTLITRAQQTPAADSRPVTATT
jgi:hypothetical protein